MPHTKDEYPDWGKQNSTILYQLSQHEVRGGLQQRINKAGAEAVILIGLSLGGMTAAWYASTLR